MTSLFAIARNTFLQQFRNRLFLVVVLFGVVMMASTLLFGALSGDQELRVILDVGFFAAEIFGLATAVFGAVTLVLEEIESKTIYLVLTRPLPRPYYVLGRFLGLLSAVCASVGLMMVVLFLLLLVKGWVPVASVFLAVPMTLFKVSVMTALALLCSLAFSSVPTALVFSVMFWVLGHFGSEIKFMASKSGPSAMFLSKVLVSLLPNMTMLNGRDFIDFPDFGAGALAWGAGYALLYVSACLALSSALFSRREF